MLLITHIIIAVTSLLQAAFAVVMPSRNTLRTTYGLIAATLATGTWLVISLHAAMLSACISGLTYLAIALTLALTAQYRLAHLSKID